MILGLVLDIVSKFVHWKPDSHVLTSRSRSPRGQGHGLRNFLYDGQA